MTPGESRFERVRGLRCHIRCWGPADAPALLLLHGWMDVSASYQFLVDELGAGWRYYAPDWRGFGLSEWAADGAYSYHDYLADLDALVKVLGLRGAVPIVGHSLGGNIAWLYGAARPERVRCIVNLEGFGLRAREAAEAPVQLRRWLDELARTPERRSYAGLDSLVERVRELSDRITAERALFVAAHWSEPDGRGGYRLLADPGHRIPGPALFRLDEARACWRAIAAPVLWVEAAASVNSVRHGLTAAALGRRRASVRDLTLRRLSDCGHMMHWEQPEQLARLIEAFLRGTTG